MNSSDSLFDKPAGGRGYGGRKLFVAEVLVGLDKRINSNKVGFTVAAGLLFLLMVGVIGFWRKRKKF
eukprot:CAMPEP_0168793072 /NCGR_PEP_ID=MMETSP0725-20121227/14883_1 /TAXON_ID=265536 /ORGANISM="Amphiprora sp., Strain CCMP467" /LENGTH=66 /DNA_ID=CAMNT_0008843809 /DNA_START=278 /DNA_END=478 /DNA_ORIENTATION=+